MIIVMASPSFEYCGIIYTEKVRCAGVLALVPKTPVGKKMNVDFGPRARRPCEDGKFNSQMVPYRETRVSADIPGTNICNPFLMRPTLSLFKGRSAWKGELFWLGFPYFLTECVC